MKKAHKHNWQVVDTHEVFVEEVATQDIVGMVMSPEKLTNFTGLRVRELCVGCRKYREYIATKLLPNT